jgi:hypothetical protein
VNERLKISSLLVAAAAVFIILGTVELPSYNQLWREIANSGHLFLFGAFALIVLEISWSTLRRRVPERIFHYLFAFVTAGISGLIVELIQLFGARDADPWDLTLDVIGAVAFLAIRLTVDRDLSARITELVNSSRYRIRIAAVLLVLVFLTPVYLAAGTLIYRTEIFPFLCRFDTYWDTRMLLVDDAQVNLVPRPEGWPGPDHSPVGKLTFLPAWYSDFLLKEPYPDWSGYQSLSMQFYNAQRAQLRVSIRIHDWWHNDEYGDRFNRTLLLRPGYNWILIPLEDVRSAPENRDMDMTRIAAVQLFTSRLLDTAVVYVDDFRLM